ncbi:hypothetical protein EV361DRAFT_957285 [Lentinula raphanica]|nr:hypothetical protein EV361DRAFT_957285 [Lentinula raphanica]
MYAVLSGFIFIVSVNAVAGFSEEFLILLFRLRAEKYLHLRCGHPRLRTKLSLPAKDTT